MHQKIMYYDICSGHTLAELAGYVNAGIKAGMQPEGNIFTSKNKEFFFHQKMVMYKAPTKKKRVTKKSK